MDFRKINDAHDAELCLRAASASGVPRSEWARANGINARSLNIWRIHLARKHDRDEQVRSPTLRMVELAPPRSLRSPTATYAVCVGPFRVELDNDFDDEAVRRLLLVVASC